MNYENMYENGGEFDRALLTKDIEGAAPGTLISKVVKNK